MDVRDAIRARRSVKKLQAPAPSASQVAELLELAATAPDHGGLSPWRFTVLEGPSLEAFPLDAGTSPMVVVVGVEPQGDKIRAEEQTAAVAAATQLLLLAADSMGYGAMWRTGSAAYDPAVARAAGLSPSGRIVAFVHLGTPADATSGNPTTPSATTPTAAPAPAAASAAAITPTAADGSLGIGSLRA